MDFRRVNAPLSDRLIDMYEDYAVYRLGTCVARLLEIVPNVQRGLVIREIQRLEKNRKTFKLSLQLMKMENYRMDKNCYDCPPPSYPRVLLNYVQSLPRDIRLRFLKFVVDEIQKTIR